MLNSKSDTFAELKEKYLNLKGTYFTLVIYAGGMTVLFFIVLFMLIKSVN